MGITAIINLNPSYELKQIKENCCLKDELCEHSIERCLEVKSFSETDCEGKDRTKDGEKLYEIGEPHSAHINSASDYTRDPSISKREFSEGLCHNDILQNEISERNENFCDDILSNNSTRGINSQNDHILNIQLAHESRQNNSFILEQEGNHIEGRKFETEVYPEDDKDKALEVNSLDEYESGDLISDIYSDYLAAYDTYNPNDHHTETYPSCDYRIICKDKLGEIFNCHKIVLSNNSTVFKKIISDAKGQENGNVHISNVSSFTIRKLLQFVYIGFKSKEFLDLELLDAAIKYNVPSLINTFVEDLNSILSISNAIDILLASHVKKVQLYKQHVIKFIIDHWDEVKLSENFKKIKDYPDLLLEMFWDLPSKGFSFGNLNR